MFEFMLFFAITGIILVLILSAVVFVIGMIYEIFKGLYADYVENVKTPKIKS